MSIKDVKHNFIVDVAAKLILKRSINDVTIKDIATEAGVGEATVYRYFSKKENLLLKVAMKLLNEVFSYFKESENPENGFTKLERFYMNYYDVFVEHPEYFKFLSEFDKFISDANLKLNLESYEAGVTQFKDVFYKAYEEGVRDGSVRKIDNLEIYYYSSTHALIELCKKKSIEKDILKQDKFISKSGEVKCLVEIILFGLKL